ncbi:MAG: hypothetical protein Fur0046_13340 [Cyanobacteria bacterium J069]|nr:MAG: hypothetical protein D6742_07020 [Cyanobacteria bacterium J069]
MAELAILGYIVGDYPLTFADTIADGSVPGKSLTLHIDRSPVSDRPHLTTLLSRSTAVLLAGLLIHQTAIAAVPPVLSLDLSPAAPDGPAVTLSLAPQSADIIAPADPSSAQASPQASPQASSQLRIAPLAVPPQATQPPLGKGRNAEQLRLPPPPTQADPPVPAAEAVASPPAASPPAALPLTASLGQAPPPLDAPDLAPQPLENHALSFELDAVPASAIAPISAATAAATPAGELPAVLQAAFSGGTESLVAIAVGSAEGTRTPQGNYTAAYQGHVDPGNGVWNLGTFSYQHGADSPAEADRKQLQRLQKQASQLQQGAAQLGLELSLAEQINGIDLANQSPRAALSRGGYLDRLLEARQQGLHGEEAILWARTRAFLDPDTQRWNAPGLGNTTEGVTRDQARRMVAVKQAIALNSASSPPTTAAPTEISPAQPVALTIGDVVNQLLSLDRNSD